MIASLAAYFQATAPVMLAAISGGPSTPALVAAVANAGGIATHACPYLAPQAILDQAAEIRALTDRPFTLNLFAGGAEIARPEAIMAAKAMLQPLHDALGLGPVADPSPPPVLADQLAAVLEARPAAVSFTFGILPAPILADCRRRGIATLGTATHPDEVAALDDAGVDAIILQGAEAGGHRGSFAVPFADGQIGTLALLQLARARTGRPLIAAGGIMGADGVRAVLAGGAQIAACGTAFLCADEAGTPAPWRRALAEAHRTPTRLTRLFSGRPARGLVNRYMEMFAAFEAEVPPLPAMNGLTRPLRTASAAQGTSDYMSLWAGQGAGLVTARGAAQIVRALAG